MIRKLINHCIFNLYQVLKISIPELRVRADHDDNNNVEQRKEVLICTKIA
jgi:hypothetical protein